MTSRSTPQPRRAISRAAVAALCLAPLTACSTVGDLVTVDRPEPRVAMKEYALDLAFGEEPAPATVPPPTRTLEEVAVDSFAPPITAPERPFATLGGPPPALACPPPGVDAAAERPITADVPDNVSVDPGIYLWRQEGALRVLGVNVLLPPMTSRIVRNYTNVGGVATFDVELDMGLRRQTQRYRVVPGDGIFLTGLTTTANGQRRDFQPLLPVEIFPFPATELAAVTGVGVDPASQQALVVTGTIVRRERLEGCGIVVDGWFVDATWTFRGAGGEQVVDIDYVVAPQHGGLVIGDHVKTTEFYGPLAIDIDVRSTIGSLQPKPERAAQ